MKIVNTHFLIYGRFKISNSQRGPAGRTGPLASVKRPHKTKILCRQLEFPLFPWEKMMPRHIDNYKHFRKTASRLQNGTRHACKNWFLRTHFTYVMHISKEPSPQKRVKLEQRNGCVEWPFKKWGKWHNLPNSFSRNFHGTTNSSPLFYNFFAYLGLLNYAFHECIKIAVCLH